MSKKAQALMKLEVLQQLQALKDAMEQNALLQNLRSSKTLNYAKIRCTIIKNMCL